MLIFDEKEFEYRGFHARAELFIDEWLGKIIETGEEIYGRTLEELEDNFHDCVKFVELWREADGETVVY